jgi:hypothetical protein
VDVVVELLLKLVILINFSYIIDMKPLNLDNSPCSPISSNCVIWQGPDIPCIKLCAGDTVSDVVFKLATELCTIMDMLDVSNYDLTCFNLVACGPNDFQALIQFLIDQICATETQVTVISDPATSPVSTTKSNDTPVEVAPCFVINGVTVMTVAEYAIAIGKKVCSIVDQIAIINNSIVNLDIRVTSLEAAPVPTFTLPSISTGCLASYMSGATSATIDLILNTLLNNTTIGYCALVSATDLPADLLAAVATQCITGSDSSLANPGDTFTSAYGPYTGFGTWQNTPVTVADAINNLWITICDIYTFSKASPITVSDTATVDLTETGNVITAKITDTGWVDLNGFAYYGAGVAKPKCRRIGNAIHFKGTVYVPLENPTSPGNVIPLASTSTYNSVAGCTTWSGAGGCTIDANGSILFNNGASVVPNSITTSNFDDTYNLGWIVATRPIDVNVSNGTSLTSVFSVSVSATKGLQAQLLHDIEITATRGSGVQGNSPLRFITSNVRVGEYLPNYIGTGTDIHNAPSNANFPLLSDTFNLTWPFSCDAGNENQVGGFIFRLDGLIAYLDPCNTETGFSVVCR